MQILIESLPSESSSTELQLTSVGQLEEDGKLASEELDRQVHTLSNQDYANLLLCLKGSKLEIFVAEFNAVLAENTSNTSNITNFFFQC
jgi:hypothetical protein